MQERLLTITSNQMIAENIYEITLKGDIGEVKGGQFMHITVPSDAKLLRRPFGISDYDSETVKCVYAILGDGTRLLSQAKSGEKIASLIGLGNGFPDIKDAKKIVLLGGGMGTVVFPAIARELYRKNIEIYTYFGFSNVNKVVCEDVNRLLSKKMVVTTDDGSYGYKGFATDYLYKDINDIKPDAIFCCGPQPMFRALKNLNINVPTYISLEERMGCGIGACLTCSCKIKENGSEHYLRVCADGPVFLLDKVVL